MKADAVDVLSSIPFRVCALAEKVATQGSYERALIYAVYDSIRHDIEYAIKQIESDRQRK